jgi:Bacterial SH3 domain
VAGGVGAGGGRLGSGSGGPPDGNGPIGVIPDPGAPPLIPVSLALITLGAGAVILAARRRRRELEPAMAVTSLEVAAALAVGEDRGGVATPVDDPYNETHMPRWRRPSLKAARTADGRTSTAPVWQLEFRDTAAPGAERRRIRYRLVRLSDAPDEIRSVEVGQLEEHDEVEVLERHASYVKVRTPAGQEGWVHRTTLGAALGMDGAELESDPSPAAEGVEPA